MHRFTCRTSEPEVASDFAVVRLPKLQDRFDILPPQPVLAVRLAQENGQRTAVMLDWGLIPRWAQDETLRNVTYTARADCVATWAAFRESFRHRRCLIVADGYYVGPEDQEQYVTASRRGLIAFAGIWDRWRGPNGNVETCSIIVTKSHGPLAEFTDEMPVVVPRSEYASWISPVQSPEMLQLLLTQYSRVQAKPELLNTYSVPSLSPRDYDAESSAISEIRRRAR